MKIYIAKLQMSFLSVLGTLHREDLQKGSSKTFPFWRVLVVTHLIQAFLLMDFGSCCCKMNEP